MDVFVRTGREGRSTVVAEFDKGFRLQFHERSVEGPETPQAALLKAPVYIMV